MEDYNWISAKNFEGKIIRVRQRARNSVYFVDEQGRLYISEQLDFCLTKDDRLSLTDWDALEDIGKDCSKTEVDKREYWRKLRGEVFLSFLHTQLMTTNDELEDVLGKTDDVIRALYAQDVDFFNDK